MKVWDSGSGEVLDTFDFFADRVRRLVVFQSQPWAIALTRMTAEPDRQDKSEVPSLIRIWNWKTGEVMMDKQVRASDTGLSLSPDERFVTLGQRHTHVRYDVSIDARQVQLTNATIFPSASLIRSPMSFSPDGRFGVSNVKWRQGLFVMWNVETGTLIRKFDLATASSTAITPFAACLAFSHDGKTIASGDFQGRVRLWQRDSGKMIAELATHRVAKVSNYGDPPRVAFTKDGRLVSGGGSADRTLHVSTFTKKKSR